jgi:hypothetical protein
LQADGFDNIRFSAALKQECEQHEQIYGIWETTPGGIKTVTNIDLFSPQCYSGEGEKLIDWPTVVEEVRHDYPDLPCSTVTNFGGNLTILNADGSANVAATKSHCAPLIEGDFRCLTECVLPENPNATIENMAWEASWRGWTQPQPVLYFQNGFDFDDYGGIPDELCWGAWSAEYVL